MDPMLAKTCNPKDIQSYIEDDDWYAQQKLDGIRLLINIDKDGKVWGNSRTERIMELPDEAKTPFEGLAGPWVLDGEFVGTGDDGAIWLFDQPEVPGIVDSTTTLDARYQLLEATYRNLFPDGSDDIFLVPLARTIEEKRKLLDWCTNNNSEGLMFKHRNGKYRSGSRSPHMLKAKFTETVDCIILEVGREGKESVAVGAFHNGVLTDIGSVKMTASQGLGKAQVGDVIEVRYLYVQRESLRLVQPVFLKFRPDRDAKSCNTDQLKYTDKTVRKA